MKTSIYQVIAFKIINSLNLGDQVDNFYVILNGSVTILLPKSKEDMEKEEENIDLVSPTSGLTNKKNKNFNSIARTITFMNLLQKRSSKNTILNESHRESLAKRTSSINSNVNSKSPNKRISQSYGNIYLNQKLNHYLEFGDLKDTEKYFENGKFKYKQSKILEVGMAFGEIDNKKNFRNEAVLCNKDSDFAIMTKNDYKEILFDIERIKKNKDLEFLSKTFLKDAPFMSKDSLLSFKYLFDKKKYNGGTVLYEKGQNSYECFLIKKGEVEVIIFLFNNSILILDFEHFRATSQ